MDQGFILLTTLHIKDLRIVKKFLCMRIFHSTGNGHDIDQEASMDEIFIKFGLQIENLMATPIGIDYDNECALHEHKASQAESRWSRISAEFPVHCLIYIVESTLLTP